MMIFRRARLWPATLLVLVLVSSGAPGLAQTLAKDAPVPPRLETLSDQLAIFQRRLHDQHGIDQIYIGGGSSRAILDALYFGKPLQTRDIDIFVVPNRKVTRGWAGKMAEDLMAGFPGKLALQNLEQRPRGNPALPEDRRYRYNAGYGFFLKQPNGEVFDISFYHRPADLDLNGCLNVDTVMIPLRSNETLTQLVDKMRGRRYATLARKGVVHDRYSGYKGWQKNRYKVVHWAELESKPELWSIRLARSFGKAGKKRLPAEAIARLHAVDRRHTKRPSRTLVVRYLSRMLADPNAEAELEMVKQAGLLDTKGVTRLLGPSQSWTVTSLRDRIAALEAKPKHPRRWWRPGPRAGLGVSPVGKPAAAGR